MADAAAAKPTKADNFKRLAVSRMEKALTAIALVGSLANKGNYDFTAEQVAKIGEALDAEVGKVGNRFKAALEGAPAEDAPGFTL